jgi:hypothetical protein
MHQTGLDWPAVLSFLAKRQMPHLMLVRGRVAKVWALFSRTVDGLWAKTSLWLGTGDGT